MFLAQDVKNQFCSILVLKNVNTSIQGIVENDILNNFFIETTDQNAFLLVTKSKKDMIQTG